MNPKIMNAAILAYGLDSPRDRWLLILTALGLFVFAYYTHQSENIWIILLRYPAILFALFLIFCLCVA